MRRGRGELLHTRQPLGERPMSWQNPVPCVSDRGDVVLCDKIRRELVCLPRFSVSDRTCTCRYRIAREEQALLAVSAAIHISDGRRMTHLKLWPVTDHSIDELRLVNS